MGKKLYFQIYNKESHDDFCYQIGHFKEMARIDNEPVMVRRAAPIIGSGLMWCRALAECIESGNGDCGKICAYYNPCNGKNGRCRELTYAYEPIGPIITITKNGVLIERENDDGSGK